MARFPHQHETWLWYGHTIPNGDPPEPFHGSTKLSSFILLTPHRVPSGFHELTLATGKTIRFFALVPLYQDELAFKLQNGAEAIEQRLLEAGHSELVEPNRKSVVASPAPRQTVLSEDIPAWYVVVAATGTDNTLRIRVTGSAATSVRWVATIRTTEVIY